MKITVSNKRSGFNLVEAAIVLGVVGLVIGGIWVAASSVTEKRRLSAASTAILQLVQSLRGSLTGQPLPNSWLWTNELVINGGFLPANWTSNASLTIFNDAGYAVNTGVAYDTTEFAQSNNHGIVLNFDNMSNAECINLVAAITSRFKDRSDLSYVAIGSATYLRSFPADMATITTNCTSRGNNPAVAFAFAP